MSSGKYQLLNTDVFIHDIEKKCERQLPVVYLTYNLPNKRITLWTTFINLQLLSTSTKRSTIQRIYISRNYTKRNIMQLKL